MHINNTIEGKSLTDNLDDNFATFQEIFKNCDTIRFRRFTSEGKPYALIFCDGLVSSEVINNAIAQRVALGSDIPVGEYTETQNIEDIVFAVMFGDCLVLGEQGYCAIMNAKGFALRGINEPEGEKILSGPREGFCENMMSNLAMLRRKLKTSELKTEVIKVGEISNTPVAICYVDGVVKPERVTEIRDKLSKIEIDGILDTQYLTELLDIGTNTAFPLAGKTERPDVAAAKLLEGRIALICDGSPVCATLPYLFIENFHSAEDYYVSPFYASFGRILRICAFALTIFLPAYFVLALSYCQWLLPGMSLAKIAVERAGVPLPVALECFLMLCVFELLREGGVRVPGYIGQALSVVGALIIGSAAVGASLVSETMVIVIAVTGLSALTVPKLSSASLLWRFVILLATAFFGVYGFAGAALALGIRLFTLKSLDMRHIFPEKKFRFQNIKDTFFRTGMKRMNERLSILSNNKTKRR